jgi:Glyoxalase superfamily protein
MKRYFMRDFRDARVMASALRDALKAKSVDTTESESLELIATLFSFENWNALSATIDAVETLMSEAASPPWARLRDALKAKGIEITLRDSVELLMIALGYEQWKLYLFSLTPPHSSRARLVHRPRFKLRMIRRTRNLSTVRSAARASTRCGK